MPEIEVDYPRTTSGDYDWEADIVERHAKKVEESKRLFREGAVGETAAEESSDDDLFPELRKERRQMTLPRSDQPVAKEAALRASSLPEGAAPSAPSSEVLPPPPPPVSGTKAEEVKAEATSEKHLRTHFPKNPFCKICNIAKNTSMRVARKPDGKADDMIDEPTAPSSNLPQMTSSWPRVTSTEGLEQGG